MEAKYGYIESISENNEVTVKRVDMLTDLNRPNGYRIDDLNRNEVFQLDENMLYFVVYEVAQGYKEITVNTVTVPFKVKDQDNTYLLIWTTTPWTLSSR